MTESASDMMLEFRKIVDETSKLKLMFAEPSQPTTSEPKTYEEAKSIIDNLLKTQEEQNKTIKSLSEQLKKSQDFGKIQEQKVEKLKIENEDLMLRESAPETFQIFVKMRKYLALTVVSQYTVGYLKEMIEKRTGTSRKLMWLNYGGKPLYDDRCLAEYNIQKDATIQLYYR